jgi:hypothetical protein
LPLKPRIDKTGYLLASIALIFFFLIPVQWEIETLANFPTGPAIPLYVMISQGIAITALFALTAYQAYRLYKNRNPKP